MTDELYNSNDYCTLAEELEQLKLENKELLADKMYLINAAMDGGDKYHYAAHDIGYRDLERKCKALEADYVISNRELLVKQVEIDRLTADNACLTAELAELREKTRWIPVSENEILQSNVTRLVYTSDKKMHLAFICEWGWIDDTNTIVYRNVTHWMPLPEPPEAD